MTAAHVTKGFRGGRKKAGREYSRPAREIVLELLKRQNLTLRQAQRLCQRDYETVRRLFKAMRDEKLIHITEWAINDVGPHEAVWALGDEPDAKNPPRMSDKERCGRYRQRRRIPVVKTDPLMRMFMPAGGAP